MPCKVEFFLPKFPSQWPVPWQEHRDESSPGVWKFVRQRGKLPTAQAWLGCLMKSQIEKKKIEFDFFVFEKKHFK